MVAATPQPKGWQPPEGARVLRSSRRCVLGVDLGQKQDPSAIAVIERREIIWDLHDRVTWNYLSQLRYSVRHAERIALGTPYPDVVRRVRSVLMHASGADACPVSLCVDATGVGPPVIDLMRESGLSRNLIPVTITGGQSEGRSSGTYTVPKRDLVTGLQVGFETKTLELSRGLRAGETLISELMAMQVSVSAAGNEKYGAMQNGAHDDLVLAVALAWWAMLRK